MPGIISGATPLPGLAPVTRELHALLGEPDAGAARIEALVDVYDALRSKRCYKPAYSWEETVEIMQDMAGGHLDAYLVDLFLGHKEQILEIAARFSDELEDVEVAAEVWG